MKTPVQKTMYRVRIIAPNDGPFQVGDEVEREDADWLIRLRIAEGVNDAAKAVQAEVEEQERRRDERIRGRFEQERQDAIERAKVLRQLRTEEFGKQLMEGT